MMLPNSLPNTVIIDSELKDLIPLFLRNRRQDFNCVSRAALDSNWREVARIAHALVGVCGSYGFSELLEVSYSLQFCAKEKNTVQIQAMVKDVHSYLDNLVLIYRDEIVNPINLSKSEE